jgi:predicted Rossmann fold flavoprotein
MHRVPWHEKHLGQLFCDRSAHDILNLLLAECAAAGARVQLSTRILSVAKNATGFLVETSTGPIAAASLVIATGGLSIPKLGATALGYDLARQFGLDIVGPRPGLVPLTFSAPDREAWCDLAGTSVAAIATIAQSGGRNRAPSFREKLLITHRGLSGPAILQISSFWSAGSPLLLDLAPEQEVFAPLRSPNAPRTPASAFEAARRVLPTRLAERWLERNLSPRGRLLSNVELATLEERLHAWPILPAGTEGFAKAEVTGGGVSTAELDPRTMQSRRVPGLYFIGEVVDVTGWLGGYNFQWAWASGAAAGQSA